MWIHISQLKLATTQQSRENGTGVRTDVETHGLDTGVQKWTYRSMVTYFQQAYQKPPMVERIVFQQMVLGQFDSHIYKNTFGLLSHTTYKNWLKVHERYNIKTTTNVTLRKKLRGRSTLQWV